MPKEEGKNNNEMRELVKKIYFFIEKYLLRLKRKKDVLLVVKHAIMLHYVRPIHEYLSKDERLRVWICCPFPHLLKENDIVKIRKIRKAKLISYKIARFLKWDLIIFPDHDPYFRKECTKIYTGHGLFAGKQRKGDHYLFGARSLTQEGKILYDKIFVTSDFIKQGVKQHYPRFYSRSKVTGSLFIDRLKDSPDNRAEILKGINLDPRKKTVMVAATWGPVSLAESQGEELLKKIPDITRKYNLIITFHLLNFLGKFAHRKNWKELLDGIDSRDVYVIQPGGDPYYFLPCADLLITDVTSLGLYYPVLERPIIYFDHPELKCGPVSLTCELRKIAHVVTNMSNICQDIEEAFEDFDAVKMKELSDKICSYQGRAWERYSAEIYGSLHMNHIDERKEPPEVPLNQRPRYDSLVCYV